METLGERIRKASDRVGGLNKLAKLVDVPRRTLGNWLTGANPKPEALRKIAEVTGVDARWLLTGEGGMLETSPKVTTKPAPAQSQTDASDEIPEDANGASVIPFQRQDSPKPPTIKYYNVAASAGGGRTALYEPPGEDLDVAELVSNLLGLDIEDVFLSPIYGDSMLPTLTHGDIAVINRRDVGLDNGRIYVLSYDGEVYVKRAQWHEDGDYLLLLSDNDQSRFPPIKVAGDEFHQITTLGRVVWIWRSV